MTAPLEKQYCPDHGHELQISYERNRYTRMVAGEYPLTCGEDFDKKTGERLYTIVGRCPVRERAFFGFVDGEESHHIATIKTDAKKL